MFDTPFFDQAVYHYLDELAVIARRARRCPLGLADPGQQIPGWHWSLAGDPGHDAVFTATRDGSHRLTGFLSIWYRQGDPPYHGQVAWDVTWHPDTGWSGTWRTRNLYHRVWRPYPGDFLVRWATSPLDDPEMMPALFIPL